MALGSESDLRLEIGHVLFIDIVGYSKLLIEDQKKCLHELGKFEVKQVAGLSLVNLCGDMVANPDPPAKFKTPKHVATEAHEKRSPTLIMVVVIGFMLFTLAVLGIIFAPAILKQPRSR